MSADDEHDQIAAALDATPALLPWLPALLADLFELGSSPSLVVEWLRDLGLPRQTTRTLDLGCGKGAVSLTLARELGFRAHGVDLCEAFVLEARETAREWGLTDLCRFEKGDLRAVAQGASGYDVVVYASVGVLGGLDTCVATLRGCVRPGGFMVVDEGFRAPNAETTDRLDELTGFEDLVGYDESRSRLMSHGDVILKEHLLTPAEMRAVDGRYIDSIDARARRLAVEHPDDAALILGYVDRQKRAADAWERAAVSAAWLLRRSTASR